MHLSSWQQCMWCHTFWWKSVWLHRRLCLHALSCRLILSINRCCWCAKSSFVRLQVSVLCHASAVAVTWRGIWLLLSAMMTDLTFMLCQALQHARCAQLHHSLQQLVHASRCLYLHHSVLVKRMKNLEMNLIRRSTTHFCFGNAVAPETLNWISNFQSTTGSSSAALCTLCPAGSYTRSAGFPSSCLLLFASGEILLLSHANG